MQLKDERRAVAPERHEARRSHAKAQCRRDLHNFTLEVWSCWHQLRRRIRTIDSSPLPQQYKTLKPSIVRQLIAYC